MREPQDFSPWWLTAGDLSQRTCELRKVPCESHRTLVRGGLPLLSVERLTCGSPDRKATFAALTPPPAATHAGSDVSVWLLPDSSASCQAAVLTSGRFSVCADGLSGPVVPLRYERIVFAAISRVYDTFSPCSRVGKSHNVSFLRYFHGFTIRSHSAAVSTGLTTYRFCGKFMDLRYVLSLQPCRHESQRIVFAAISRVYDTFSLHGRNKRL